VSPRGPALRRQGRYKFHHLDTTPLEAILEGGDQPAEGKHMRIYMTSVLVDDQDKAQRFYTDVLGFVKKTDIPLGEARWLTVVSPDDPEGPELLLEPDTHPAAGPSKAALVAEGTRPPPSPWTTCTPSSAAAWPGRPVHPGAARDGRGDDGGVRRHLR
jgi:catechol 2,3-dioxygenase-like lactoylglutathione lyase family enzyme